MIKGEHQLTPYLRKFKYIILYFYYQTNNYHANTTALQNRSQARPEQLPPAYSNCGGVGNHVPSEIEFFIMGTCFSNFDLEQTGKV